MSSIRAWIQDGFNSKWPTESFDRLNDRTYVLEAIIKLKDTQIKHLRQRLEIAERLEKVEYMYLPDIAREAQEATGQKVDAIRYSCPYGYEFGMDTSNGITWWPLWRAPSSVEKYIKDLDKAKDD